LKEKDIEGIAAIMNKVAEAPESEANLADCRAQAESLIGRFPLYPSGYFED
jgi:glycine hydroxymethyltransferase